MKLINGSFVSGVSLPDMYVAIVQDVTMKEEQRDNAEYVSTNDTFGLSEVDPIGEMKDMTAPIMEMSHHDMDTESFMRKFSRELARNGFKLFMSDLAVTGVESTWKDLLAAYRKIKLAELHRMRVEISNTEKDIKDASWISIPRVTITDCVLAYKDESGNDRTEYVESEMVTRKEFERALNQGRLIAAVEDGETIGMVTGYTDVMDVEIEDFNNVDEIYVDHGNDIVEVLTREWFLETITAGSNTDIIRYLNDAEIKYGNSQEGYGAEHAEYANAMSELIRERMATANSIEYKAYIAEQLEERKLGDTNDKLAAQVKNFNDLKDLICNAATHHELFKAGEGKLFPKGQEALFMADPNNSAVTIHKGIAHNVWSWIPSAVNKKQRKELKDLYKRNADNFRAIKQALRENAWNKLLAVEGIKDGIWTLTPDEAYLIKQMAQEHKMKTKQNLLSYHQCSPIYTLAARKAA